MRAILFNPRSSANGKPILPCALLAVGAVLPPRHDYAIVDGNLEDDPYPALLAAVHAAEREGERPVLGFTVMPGPQLHQSLPLVTRLGEERPDVPVVWGGYFPTQHWQAVVRSPHVDVAVRGHAEFAFRALLDAFEDAGADSVAALGGQVLRAIPGLAFVDPDTGEPRTNALAPIPHPRDLPGFDFERLPIERYVRSTFLGSRTLGYHSSYGCPFKCNFCAVVNMVGGRWFPQPAPAVLDVARHYVRDHGVDAIEFYDNNFFTHEKRVVEFARGLIDEGLEIGWWGEARVDTLNGYKDESWRLMAEAGLKMVFMGAESGDEDALARMNKGGTLRPQDTLALAEKAAGHGIVPEFSFVMGTPPDPAHDIEQNIRFIRRIKGVNPAAEIIMYLYTPEPLPGDLLDAASDSGFRFPETLEEWADERWQDFTQRRSGVMPWVGDRSRQTLRDFESVLNAYHPTTTDAGLSRMGRRTLRAMSGWRYRSGRYRRPYELRLLQRALAYQRPETSGF